MIIQKKEHIVTYMVFILVAELSSFLGKIGEALNKQNLFGFLTIFVSMVGAFIIIQTYKHK